MRGFFLLLRLPVRVAAYLDMLYMHQRTACIRALCENDAAVVGMDNSRHIPCSLSNKLSDLRWFSILPVCRSVARHIRICCTCISVWHAIALSAWVMHLHLLGLGPNGFRCFSWCYLCLNSRCLSFIPSFVCRSILIAVLYISLLAAAVPSNS